MQDSVTPAWSVIHPLTGNLSELHASIYYFDSLFNILDRHLNQFLNVDFAVILLSDLQVLPLLRIE